MIRVLVADDQVLVRDGLATMLEAEDDLDVVAVAVDGREAVEGVRAHAPDVILMDVRMPVLDGIEATRQIVASGQRSRVLILTTFDLDEYVYDAIRAGASGFLLKDVGRADLVHAVRSVARGDVLLAPAVTARLIAEYARRPPPGGTADSVRALTARELDVLRLVGRGLGNAEIGARLFIAETTVKTHVARVLAKLGLPDRIHAVVFAYETGLVTPTREWDDS
ncbi:response regulator [Microbacterium elymi]|uniref:Response regulator transcription factor n=1 Tax=Microbacterium elymi TaxID=2909587 RepID=A0ABY5NJN0_9MICO|nr:response regulator transcription factor [Microbacterium elymi]UUT35377.1 response regulator transcription factor [Microbacterium elymi]